MVFDTNAFNGVDDWFAVGYALGAPAPEVETLFAAPFDNDRSSGSADYAKKRGRTRV